MKVNDRGTMKWTSLMLPEHVEALRTIWDDQDHKEMPELDEQQIFENMIVLQDALEHDLPIRIKHYANNDHLFDEGYLLSIDKINQIIFMEETEIHFKM